MKTMYSRVMKNARLIDFYLGQMIRQAREDAEMDLKALAAKTGIPRSTIAAVETASRPLMLSTAVALFLGIRPVEEWLAPMTEVSEVKGGGATDAEEGEDQASTSTTASNA